MPEFSSSTDWLDLHALDDDSFAEAYESLGSKGRSVLKKCIARLYQVWGELPSKENHLRGFPQGFGVKESSIPADYVVLACDSAYPFPAAFLAALLPALLAGVEPVLPLFIPFCKSGAAQTGTPPLLAALELAGVERAFFSTEDSAVGFFTDLAGRRPNGRLVLLGPPGFGEKLALEAHRKGLVCRSLTRPARYFSTRFARVAEHHFEFQNAASTCQHTVFSEENVTKEGVFLDLDADHEDIWFWPDLRPDWFRIKRMRLFSL